MNMPEHKENLMLRRVSRIVKGMPATDGAGVELTRVIGQPVLPMLDPFLLLKYFNFVVQVCIDMKKLIPYLYLHLLPSFQRYPLKDPLLLSY